MTTLYIAVGQSAGDQFGYSVGGGLGDVNDDGKDDFIVGAPFFGNADGGRIYVYRGDESTRLWIRNGPAGSEMGTTVAAIGDQDCDGVNDVAAGAPARNDDTGLVRTFSGTDGVPRSPANGAAAGDDTQLERYMRVDDANREALPERLRVVCRLHYFEELTAKAIAARLRVGFAAVRKRLERARRQLRICMERKLQLAQRGVGELA